MAAPRKKDWDRLDIIYALRRAHGPDGRGWTLRRLSLAHGYSENACVNTLENPWPAVEAIIARALGLHPRDIWPSRYNSDGTPKRRTAHPLRAPHRRRVSNGSAA